MPTFTTFASLTGASTTALDNNFLVLAAMSATPCSVAGTNALVLTQLTNTPTVSAYNQLQMFSGLAVNTNSGSVTATVGAIGALGGYKDTAAGPVPLTGGEIVAENAFMLVYDANLNAGSGGFHLVTGPAAFVGVYAPLAGAAFTGAISSPTVSASKLGIGGGSLVTRQTQTFATLVYTAILPGTVQGQTIGLTGVSITDIVSLGLPPAPYASVTFAGFVQTANSVVVNAYNYGMQTVTPGSVSMRVEARGYT